MRIIITLATVLMVALTVGMGATVAAEQSGPVGPLGMCQGDTAPTVIRDRNPAHISAAFKLAQAVSALVTATESGAGPIAMTNARRAVEAARAAVNSTPEFVFNWTCPVQLEPKP